MDKNLQDKIELECKAALHLGGMSWHVFNAAGVELYEAHYKGLTIHVKKTGADADLALYNHKITGARVKWKDGRKIKLDNGFPFGHKLKYYQRSEDKVPTKTYDFSVHGISKFVFTDLEGGFVVAEIRRNLTEMKFTVTVAGGEDLDRIVPGMVLLVAFITSKN